MNDEIVLKWLEERISDIAEMSDLEDKENKKVFDILNYIYKRFKGEN